MSSDEYNDDDVFLSPSADIPPGCEGGVAGAGGAAGGGEGGVLMGAAGGVPHGTHIVNGSRPSSGYYSRQTSGYTASQDTPPPSAGTWREGEEEGKEGGESGFRRDIGRRTRERNQ